MSEPPKRRKEGIETLHACTRARLRAARWRTTRAPSSIAQGGERLGPESGLKRRMRPTSRRQPPTAAASQKSPRIRSSSARQGRHSDLPSRKRRTKPAISLSQTEPAIPTRARSSRRPHRKAKVFFAANYGLTGNRWRERAQRPASSRASATRKTKQRRRDRVRPLRIRRHERHADRHLDRHGRPQRRRRARSPRHLRTGSVVYFSATGQLTAGQGNNAAQNEATRAKTSAARETGIGSERLRVLRKEPALRRDDRRSGSRRLQPRREPAGRSRRDLRPRRPLRRRARHRRRPVPDVRHARPDHRL